MNGLVPPPKKNIYIYKCHGEVDPKQPQGFYFSILLGLDILGKKCIIYECSLLLNTYPTKPHSK